MILVAGSTGYLGSEICRRLAAAGQPVRGLIRSTSAPARVAALHGLGVTTVVGDLRDLASLLPACQGAETVITTANTISSRQPGDSIAATDQQGQLNLVAAARAAGVCRFILVSTPRSLEANPLSEAKQSVEAAVLASGMDYTILCPGLFMESFLSPALGFDYPNAQVTIYGDGHTPSGFIAQADVARCAVASLDIPAARNAVLELAASPACSLLEIVRIFEQVSGKSYALQFVPAAALAAGLASAADPLQATFAVLLHSLALGIPVDTTLARQLFPFSFTTVEDYARRVLAV